MITEHAPDSTGKRTYHHPSDKPSPSYDDEDDEDMKANGENRLEASTKITLVLTNGVSKSRGLTHCHCSVTAIGKTRGRKNRKDYPSSWGFDKCQMTLRKRIMVRLKLSEGTAYVTDLVVQTMKHAECFLNATEDEKGPWISDNLTE
ncbi:hypothetical protein G3M48_002340, partial [Beauveria asiatica]